MNLERNHSLLRSAGAFLLVGTLLAVLVSCTPSLDSRSAEERRAAEDFHKVIEVVKPGMTVADASQADFLTQIDPQQWDGRIGDVNAFVAFDSNGRLLVGRIGVAEHNLLQELRPRLEALYGAPKRVEDQWGMGSVVDYEAELQEGGIRSEVKLAFPGEVDLVYHSSYHDSAEADRANKKGGVLTPPSARPQETTLRLGGD